MNQGVPDTIRYTLPGSTRHYTIYSTRDYQTILDIIYNQAVPDPNEYIYTTREYQTLIHIYILPGSTGHYYKYTTREY